MKNFFLFVLLICASILNAQWSEQTSNVTAILKSVYAINSTTVWVCGYTGTVLRTTNTGSTWQNVSSDMPTTVSLVNIVGIDANTALVAGYTGTNTWVWKTTNGGVNWTQVFAETGGFVDAIYMYSPINGLLIGDPVGGRWSMWKTTDAGTTWDSTGMYLPQVGTEAGWNNAICGVPPYVWFGTNNSKIYYSTNNGTSWTAQSTGSETKSYAISCYNFSTSYNGFAGGATLLTTTNAGSNWNTLTAPGSGSYSGISTLLAPMVQCVWIVRNGSPLIYGSLDNGATWSLEYTASTGYYWHISAGKPGVGFWAVRSNGGISYRQPITNINTISSQTPENYSVSQNYPNPFNPKTNIRYQISKTGFVSLRVYDISGKEVNILVNDNQSAGTYQVSFDGSNFSSGIYYYTLSTENFRETRKMILVK
jgi:photosystem II stability/assembly factor-like uncharacterized protein